MSLPHDVVILVEVALSVSVGLPVSGLANVDAELQLQLLVVVLDHGELVLNKKKYLKKTLKSQDR